MSTINVCDAVKSKPRLSVTEPSREPSSKNNNITKVNNNSDPVADNESDESLRDFKSPTKIVVPKKKKSKAQQEKEWRSRPPPPHHGFKNTQEMIVTMFKERKANDTEYLSENEFEIFQQKKSKREQPKSTQFEKSNSSTNTNRTSVTREEPKTDVVKKASKSKHLKDVECQTDVPIVKEIREIGIQCDGDSCTVSDGDQKAAPKNLWLRKEVRNIKVQGTILSDSEDDMIPCSQVIPKRVKKLKIPCQMGNGSITTAMSIDVSSELCETSKNESAVEKGTEDNRDTVKKESLQMNKKLEIPCQMENGCMTTATSNDVSSELCETSKNESAVEKDTEDNSDTVKIESLQMIVRQLRKKVKLPSLRGSTRSRNSLICCYWKQRRYIYVRKLLWLNVHLKKQYIQSRLRLASRNLLNSTISG